MYRGAGTGLSIDVFCSCPSKYEAEQPRRERPARRKSPVSHNQQSCGYAQKTKRASAASRKERCRHQRKGIGNGPLNQTKKPFGMGVWLSSGRLRDCDCGWGCDCDPGHYDHPLDHHPCPWQMGAGARMHSRHEWSVRGVWHHRGS